LRNAASLNLGATMNHEDTNESLGIAAGTRAWLAMAAMRLAHVRMAFVIVIVLLAVAMSTMVVQVDKQLSDLRGAPGDNANWNVLQVQTEASVGSVHPWAA
jgi:hypothetical protein